MELIVGDSFVLTPEAATHSIGQQFCHRRLFLSPVIEDRNRLLVKEQTPAYSCCSPELLVGCDWWRLTMQET